MNYAYYCNTCPEMFESDVAESATMVCPRANGAVHDVEYAGPIYFDLDDLDTGESPPAEIGSQPWVGSPAIVSTPKVTAPLQVTTPTLTVVAATIPAPVGKQEVDPPKKPSFADLAKQGGKPTLPTISAPKPKPLVAIPEASHSATTMTGTLGDDYEAIMKVVFAERGATTTIMWTSATGAGPSVRVETKLKRGDQDAERLYRAVRVALHGKRIPGTRGLTFYVTQLAGSGSTGINQMKAGFRITSHKKNSHSALAVLHVEN